MRISALQKLAVVGLLIAFVVLSVAAVLPHSHAGHAGSAPHACVVCRAQTAQPHLDLPASTTPLLHRLPDCLTPCITPLVSSAIVPLPQSRAPPVLS